MTDLAPPPVGSTNVELIRWAFDVLNTHDVTPLKPYWTADTVERFPTRTCRGPEEIASYFDATFAAVPDFHVEVVNITGSGEDVFAHWHLTGTHSGAPFEGIEPSGRPLALDGIDHFVVRDGMVVSNFVVYDQMQFARQIGMVPADGSPGDRAMKTAFNLRLRVAERLRR